MSVLWNFDDVNFVALTCTDCGPFTAVVYKHNDDYVFLEEEENNHIEKFHGG